MRFKIKVCLGIIVVVILIWIFSQPSKGPCMINEEVTREDHSVPEDDAYIHFTKKRHVAFKDSSSITKIIHQSWKRRRIPKMFRKYRKSWKTCFPYWEHKLWTDEDNRKLIKIHYPWFLEKYDSLPASIYKADCARYAYMLKYGGLYTDLDNECLRPFEHLLSNYSMVFGTIDYVPRQTILKENYVQNSFMYSRPNNPFWLGILLVIYESNITHTADIDTGPTLLSTMIHYYRRTHLQSHGIKIYPARYFNPLTWGESSMNPEFCKIWGTMSFREYEQCHEHYVERGSYVVQYHFHTWGRGTYSKRNV